jgi:DNA polymerase III delta prime subunit
VKVENILFTEKYRPKTLDELIVPGRVMEKLKNGVYQHLLLYGSPGTGKTSSAKVLVREFGHPVLYINASTDTSVDVVRNRITDFCANRSIMDESGKMKVIILDEIDGVSDQFFKALRATMDQFHTNARFVATCNYVNKVPDPIQSRFECINFDFSKEEETELIRSYILRIHEICKKEGIEMDKHAIVELVKRKFPDLRSMLNTIQGYYSQGQKVITLADVRKFNSIYKDVYELVFNNVDPIKNYQYLVSEYSSKVEDVLASLGNNDFVEYIKTEQPEHQSKLPHFTITVAKYQAMRSQVIDQVVTMLACIYEMQNIVKGA